jgi:hypothetical protein
LFSPWDTFACQIAQEVADKHGVALELHDMDLAGGESPDYAYVFSAKVEHSHAMSVAKNLLEAQNEFDGGIKRLVEFALQKRD